MDVTYIFVSTLRLVNRLISVGARKQNFWSIVSKRNWASDSSQNRVWNIWASGGLRLMKSVIRLTSCYRSECFVYHRGSSTRCTDIVVNCLHFGWHLRGHGHRCLLLLLISSIVWVILRRLGWFHFTEEICIIFHRVHFVHRRWIYSAILILWLFFATVISIQSSHWRGILHLRRSHVPLRRIDNCATIWWTLVWLIRLLTSSWWIILRRL